MRLLASVMRTKRMKEGVKEEEEEEEKKIRSDFSSFRIKERERERWRDSLKSFGVLVST